MNTLKNTLLVSTLGLASLLFIPNVAVAQSSDHTSHGAHMSDSKMDDKKSEVIMGEGVVHSVNQDEHKINITHQPIPEIKWPTMTMDVVVAEGVDLTTLSPDDAIKFHIELGDDKIYRITHIMKDEASEHHMDKEHCEAGTDCPMHHEMKVPKSDQNDGHDHQH